MAVVQLGLHVPQGGAQVLRGGGLRLRGRDGRQDATRYGVLGELHGRRRAARRGRTGSRTCPISNCNRRENLIS